MRGHQLPMNGACATGRRGVAGVGVEGAAGGKGGMRGRGVWVGCGYAGSRSQVAGWVDGGGGLECRAEQHSTQQQALGG